jgi:hypothetical protein
MKINEAFPPIYDEILKYGMKPNEYTVFTYGDTIYNPHKIKIPEDLLAHEITHMGQQQNPKEWWNKYLTDKKFRLSQELEAYKEQIKFASKHIKDRNALNKYKLDIADFLSSPIYGNIVSKSDAFRMLS